jgi:hypothetical protein
VALSSTGRTDGDGIAVASRASGQSFFMMLSTSQPSYDEYERPPFEGVATG